MRNNILRGILLSLALLILAACGGGGGGDSTKTSATLKISLNGTIGADAIAGAGFILTLPANVTPATSGGVVATNVVIPSGTFAGGTITPVTYTPAVGATPGNLEIVVANSVPAGVTTVGEIATVTLQLANGATPVAADFPVNTISVTNPSGGVIPGMTASVTAVTLQ